MLFELDVSPMRARPSGFGAPSNIRRHNGNGGEGGIVVTGYKMCVIFVQMLDCLHIQQLDCQSRVDIHTLRIAERPTVHRLARLVLHFSDMKSLEQPAS
jgi:hypothetical protein